MIREIPQVQQQLEGENTDQVEAQLQSQALSQLVLQQVVLQGAAEEDVDVSDQQVSDRQGELVDEAGSEDAFAEQLASAGVPESQLDQELRASIAFELVTEKLLADAGVDPSETASPTEGGSAAPARRPEPAGPAGLAVRTGRQHRRGGRRGLRCLEPEHRAGRPRPA